VRKQGERLLPRDIIDRARSVAYKIAETADAQDPAAALRRIVDSFATMSVMPTDLVAFLGKPLERAQPKDIGELRGAFTAMKDGEATWDQIMEGRDQGTRDEQDRIAAEKLAALKKDAAPPADPGVPMTEAQMKAEESAQLAAESSADPAPVSSPSKSRLSFGRRS
jgi:hypothetical protein